MTMGSARQGLSYTSFRGFFVLPFRGRFAFFVGPPTSSFRASIAVGRSSQLIRIYGSSIMVVRRVDGVANLSGFLVISLRVFRRRYGRLVSIVFVATLRGR